jgi:hypothetical protein
LDAENCWAIAHGSIYLIRTEPDKITPIHHRNDKNKPNTNKHRYCSNFQGRTREEGNQTTFIGTASKPFVYWMRSGPPKRTSSAEVPVEAAATPVVEVAAAPVVEVAVPLVEVEEAAAALVEVEATAPVVLGKP